jgi:hypothetical protein
MKSQIEFANMLRQGRLPYERLCEEMLVGIAQSVTVPLVCVVEEGFSGCSKSSRGEAQRHKITDRPWNMINEILEDVDQELVWKLVDGGHDKSR